MWINLSDEDIASIEAAQSGRHKWGPSPLEALVDRIEAEKLTWTPNNGHGPAACTLVDVEFRHGGIATNRPAMEWVWSIDNDPYDIVAYRLVEDFPA